MEGISFQALMEHSAGLFVLLNKEGRLLYANAAAEALFGGEPAALLGRDFFTLLHPEDAAALRAGWAQGLTQRRALSLRGLQGSGRPLWATLSPCAYAPNEEGLLVEAHEPPEGAGLSKREALSMLSVGVSHELNNALATIFGFAGMLGPSLSAEGLNDLAEILDASRRVEALSEQLSMMSGHYSRKPSLVSLSAPVRRCVFPLQQRSATLRISLELEESALAWVDEGHLDLILDTILQHAIEAMPQGGQLSISTHLEDAAYVGLTIRDSSAGLRERARASIFDPFFATKKGAGGLAMSVVYGLIERNQGRIIVESKLGVGTTYRLYFERQLAPESRR